jgi:hypothetical protein
VTLAAALARVRALEQPLPATLGDIGAPGLVRIADLAGDRDGVLAEQLDRMAAARRLTRPKVIGAMWDLLYAWVVSSHIALLLLDAPVPRPDPERSAVRIGPRGNPLELVLDPALAGDAATGAEAVSRARDAAHAYVDPVAVAVAHITGFRRIPAWGLIAATVADAALDVGELLGDVDRGLAVAEQLLADGGLGARMRPRILVADAGGQARPFPRRRTCCLNYQEGAGTCEGSCPKLSDDTLRAQRRDWITS